MNNMNNRARTRGVPAAPRRPSAAGGMPVGKLLISAAALRPAVGAVAADWNETHVFNPTWPPHAKLFHNAQTITLAVEMAAVSLWELWGLGPANRSRLRRATLCGGLFWLTQVPAILFPGTAFVDPDHPTQPFSVAGIPINQVTIQAAILAPLRGAGYAAEARRLREVP